MRNSCLKPRPGWRVYGHRQNRSASHLLLQRMQKASWQVGTFACSSCRAAAQDRELAAGGFRPHVRRRRRALVEVRQQEMEDAISSGNQLDVTRLASVMGEGAVQLRT